MADVYIPMSDKPVKVVLESGDSILVEPTDDPDVMRYTIPTAMLKDEEGDPIKVGVFEFDVRVK